MARAKNTNAAASVEDPDDWDDAQLEAKTVDTAMQLPRPTFTAVVHLLKVMARPHDAKEVKAAMVKAFLAAGNTKSYAQRSASKYMLQLESAEREHARSL